jgi:hypothetical protein
MAVNAVTPLSSIGRSRAFSAIVRCAVLETGRNSVSPSTTPSSADSRIEMSVTGFYSPSPDSSRTSAIVRSAATRSSRLPAYEATEIVVTPASA